jgi:hypothetical protein
MADRTPLQRRRPSRRAAALVGGLSSRTCTYLQEPSIRGARAIGTLPHPSSRGTRFECVGDGRMSLEIAGERQGPSPHIHSRALA